jgi:hypothetical protein
MSTRRCDTCGEQKEDTQYRPGRAKFQCGNCDRQDDSPEFVIRCWSHGGDIASGDDEAEVRELAEEAEALYHGESGEWICAKCYQAEMDYARSQMPVLRAEQAARRYEEESAEDPIGAYLRAKGRI